MEDPLKPPPWHLWPAYRAVAGGFLAVFAGFGFLSSFGAFEVYYRKSYIPTTSEATISWIGSVQGAFLLGGSIFAGPLLDMIGIRPLMLAFTLFFTVACVATSFTHEWWQIFLAQGIFLGLGLTVGYSPPLLSALSWFEKRSPLAIGIISSGIPVGGVVWPVLIQALLDRVGFAWTWRAIALIGCVVLSIATCLTDMPSHRKPENWKSMGSRLKLSELLYLPLFRSVDYSLLSCAYIFIEFGFFYLVFYISTLAVEKGASQGLAFYSLSVLNAGSFFGRLVLCSLPMKLREPFTAILISTVGCAVVLFSCPAVASVPGVMVLGLLYGFFSGGAVGLIATCVAATTPDSSRNGAALGQLSLITALPALFSGPIYGWLIGARDPQASNPHLYAQMFSAACYTVASALTLALVLMTRRRGCAHGGVISRSSPPELPKIGSSEQTDSVSKENNEGK